AAGDRAAALAADDDLALGDRDLDVLRVDAGEIDHERHGGRVVGAVVVDVGAEAAAQTGEAGHLPHVGEELLEFALQPVDVALAHGTSVPPGGRSTRLVSAH